MQESSYLVGKLAIALDDGSNLGKVEDIYLDGGLSAVTAVHLGQEGLLRRKDLLVQRIDVTLIGKDVLLVNEAASLTEEGKIKEATGWIRWDDLAGRQVVSTIEAKVARLKDVLLDESGQVLGFKLDRVAIEGPLAEKKAIAREAIVDSGGEDGPMIIDLNRVAQNK